jgi:hypothetical protein
MPNGARIQAVTVTVFTHATSHPIGHGAIATVVASQALGSLLNRVGVFFFFVSRSLPSCCLLLDKLVHLLLPIPPDRAAVTRAAADAPRGLARPQGVLPSLADGDTAQARGAVGSVARLDGRERTQRLVPLLLPLGNQRRIDNSVLDTKIPHLASEQNSVEISNRAWLCAKRTEAHTRAYTHARTRARAHTHMHTHMNTHAHTH